MSDETERDPFEDFLNGLEAAQQNFDPQQVITLSTTNGQSVAVPATEPMSIARVIEVAGLTVGATMQYYVSGDAVNSDFVVAPGGSITAVGTVKGG